ncbi:MAG: hypothetical protein WCH39_25775 [Schlesneria sp.]
MSKEAAITRKTSIFGRWANPDLTPIIPPLAVAVVSALLYILQASIGYQIPWLTVDHGRICLFWLPYVCAVLMTRMYGVPAAVGVGIGAFCVGMSSPLHAPWSSAVAAIGNVVQVWVTLVALERYETQQRTRHRSRSFNLFVFVFTVTTLISSVILCVSAVVDGQRKWGEVLEGVAGWVAGDMFTAAAVWYLLSRLGFRLKDFTFSRDVSPKVLTENVVTSTKGVCNLLLLPVLGRTGYSPVRADAWIDEWMGGQRAIGRHESAIRCDAIVHLTTEVTSTLTNNVGIVSPSLRDYCDDCVSSFVGTSIKLLFWVFVDYWRK